MGRPIDADALWVEIIHSMDYCDDILEIIEKQPTVELERKKGKWLPHKSIFGGLGERVYTCDKCGYNIGFHRENFCPNCGADMRGD